MNYIVLFGYLVVFMPLLAFLIIVSLTRKLRLTSAIISIAAIFVSFIMSCIILFLRVNDTNVHNIIEYNLPWLYIGTLNLNFGILINNLTAIMFIVVTTVSLLVQIYSIGYMQEDNGFSRFFAFLSLFSFSMLGIVISNNLLQLYIFWELVGLCSYLLIGFWYHKPEAADAAKKAFVVTRFGDFGFLLGILILTYNAGTFNFIEIEKYLKAGNIDNGLLTIILLLLFCGAVGKSGQFPLHVWLPDAMEGPTPVSALIHAATMVAAGVFMVARLFDIFSLSQEALNIIAYIGGFTAILSATIALTQDDIKRVLAYSTLSQLGYMMLALGVSGYTAGMFHLYTHAFFKALLFLCAGSVIHAMHTNNIWEMGGLHKKMPVTSVTFFIAALAISGIFPLSGFWSKDEILLNVYESGNKILYWTAVATAFLTAFYMFRIYFVTFTGNLKDEHVHESPKVMTVPLMLLAFLSIISGFVGIPGAEKSIYKFLYTGEHPHEVTMNLNIAVSSNIIALSGIILAFVIYGLKIIKPETMKKITGLLYVVSKNKYFIDEIYLFLIRNIFISITEFVKWFDRHIVDGTVNVVAFLCRWAGAKLRLTITGNLQNYALIIFSGFILMVVLFAIFEPNALKILGGR